MCFDPRKMNVCAAYFFPTIPPHVRLFPPFLMSFFLFSFLTMHDIPLLRVVHQEFVPVCVQQATQLLLAQAPLPVGVQVFLIVVMEEKGYEGEMER